MIYIFFLSLKFYVLIWCRKIKYAVKSKKGSKNKWVYMWWDRSDHYIIINVWHSGLQNTYLPSYYSTAKYYRLDVR